jgi:hypothetical protein
LSEFVQFGIKDKGYFVFLFYKPPSAFGCHHFLLPFLPASLLGFTNPRQPSAATPFEKGAWQRPELNATFFSKLYAVIASPSIYAGDC